MHLPEWCQTHSLKDFFHLTEKLAEDGSTKEHNMDTNTNVMVDTITPQMMEAHTIPAIGTPEVDVFIKEVTQANGENTLVQTEEDIGGTPL